VHRQAAGGTYLDLLPRELRDRDVIRLDPYGIIEVAYPFSARPTAPLVTIAGGPTVYAMCAIDARAAGPRRVQRCPRWLRIVGGCR
jgi:hypothetical protein